MNDGPRYCQTALDVCHHESRAVDGQPFVFAAYSSHRSDVQEEIRSTLRTLDQKTEMRWVSWEEMEQVEDNMLFCEICRHIRSARALLVELTDLNFNVVFEYGYAIGLSKKIHPVVSSSFDFRKVTAQVLPPCWPVASHWRGLTTAWAGEALQSRAPGWAVVTSGERGTARMGYLRRPAAGHRVPTGHSFWPWRCSS